MAQAGIHGMVGTAVRRWTPNQTWLPLGIVVGSLLPDLDNLAVAFATLTQRPTDGLHRTFTHSLFTVAALIVGFYIVELLTGRTKWRNLGLGLGIGVLLHILLDRLIWFNGVAILWPLSSWINLWADVSPPEWFAKLLLPLEFLFLALFFLLLARRAHAVFRRGTGQVVTSTPTILIARRIKGMTVVFRSEPPVRPVAATVPPYFSSASNRARTFPPTVSTAPAQRGTSRGRAGCSSSDRLIISLAPS